MSCCFVKPSLNNHSKRASVGASPFCLYGGEVITGVRAPALPTVHRGSLCGIHGSCPALRRNSDLLSQLSPGSPRTSLTSSTQSSIPNSPSLLNFLSPLFENKSRGSSGDVIHRTDTFPLQSLICARDLRPGCVLDDLPRSVPTRSSVNSSPAFVIHQSFA